MQLAHLTLTDFRNFASLQTEFPPGPTIIVGANAQGKTSLLEAVYYLVGASSPHASHDSQLIRLEAKPRIARVVAELERADRKETIEIRLIVGSLENGQERLRKEILINGVKKRAMDLHGRFNAVLFLPRDVQVNELRRGLTLTGPQRDDLSLQINGLELRHYGSRGQNRTAMLAFKLAQVNWLRQYTGEQPVLLLDEVLAELDPERRGYLLQRLPDSHQALLTAADVGMFDEPFLERATRWTIEAGFLSE